MKKRFLTLLLGVVMSASADATVDNSDLAQIRQLVKDGKYEEALQRQLYFHEESKTSPGMGGVRVSFALHQWVELGEKYPKALDALKEIRDHDGALLVGGKGNFQTFMDYDAINHVLDEEDKTYALFQTTSDTRPKLAGSCYGVVRSLLVRRKDYALCGKYLGDPSAAYSRIEEMRNLNIDLAQRSPTMNNDHFKQYSDGHFVDETVELLDILAHLGRSEEAKAIQARALQYFPDPRISQALP